MARSESAKRKQQISTKTFRRYTNLNSKLSEEIYVLKGRSIKQDYYSSRENLRFYNIAEEHGDTNVECFAKVKKVLECVYSVPRSFFGRHQSVICLTILAA